MKILERLGELMLVGFTGQEMSTALAIDGGTPLRAKPYPPWPQWDEREEAALLGVLRSGQWWAPGGTQVKKLEEEFAGDVDLILECGQLPVTPSSVISLVNDQVTILREGGGDLSYFREQM